MRIPGTGEQLTVDILCRVVDNLGDIGFVYRLTRALGELPDAPEIRLVVDDLASFAGICPGVAPDLSLQTVEGRHVARMDAPDEETLRLFSSNPPRMVLECYACGRPAWFEDLLFDDEKNPGTRFIINLEYLTAESWAPDFHKLPSLTRSPLVKKSIFMPGFVPGTGGLVEDAPFRAVADLCATTTGKIAVRQDLAGLFGTGDTPDASTNGAADATESPAGLISAFWCSVFSYEHDFSSIVADLAAFHAERPVLTLVAAGRSAAPFLEAWNRAGRPFPVRELPLLPQKTWDRFLAASDFAIVRGEETLARSCLAGHPFLWQCYPFAEANSAAGQLPKVHAFLELLEKRIESGKFDAYKRLTLAFNGPAETAPGDLLAVLRALDDPESGDLTGAFAVWAQEVRNLGNLAANLLTFMRDLG